MNNHADETTHGDRRVHLHHRSVALTLGDVTTEQFVNAPDEFFEKHFCQFVTLERRIKQQTLKIRI